MPQFHLHRDTTRANGPLLLNLQSDLTESLHTRLVAPVYPLREVERQTISGLTPIVEFGGTRYAVMVPRMAAIAASDLGATVADLSRYRGELVAAVDLLVTGI